MYLIWRMDTTAKGAKKNTSPNIIHLQYCTMMTFISIIIRYTPLQKHTMLYLKGPDIHTTKTELHVLNLSLIHI